MRRVAKLTAARYNVEMLLDHKNVFGSYRSSLDPCLLRAPEDVIDLPDDS